MGVEEAILAIAALEVKPMVQKSTSTTKPNAIAKKKVKWTVLGTLAAKAASSESADAMSFSFGSAKGNFVLQCFRIGMEAEGGNILTFSGTKLKKKGDIQLLTGEGQSVTKLENRSKAQRRIKARATSNPIITQ